MELKFNINGQHITRSDFNYVVSDSIGYISCRFDFSEEWAGKVKTAVFKNDETTYNVVLADDRIASDRMPVFSDGEWHVSVFGGNLITADSVSVKIACSGYAEGDAPTPPPQNVYDTLTELVAASDAKAVDAKAAALEIRALALAGEFDGSDGKSAYEIAVENGFSGTEQEWLASLKGDSGSGGTAGADGVSPTVTITSIQNGHRISITDKTHPSGQSFDVTDGSDGADGADGQDGNDGADGVSPTVSIATVAGGHTVTITDATYPNGQTFTVTDGVNGTNGTNGQNGYTPVRGTDYWTAADQAAIVADVLSHFDDVSEVGA